MLNGDILDVETDIVTWDGLFELLVMHLNRLDLSGEVGWGEGDGHAWLEDTGLDSADWDRTDTRDLVDILEWESEWLVDRSLGGLKLIESLVESLTLVPLHVVEGIHIRIRAFAYDLQSEWYKSLRTFERSFFFDQVSTSSRVSISPPR